MHKLALVTGASSGLGKALALKLAEKGTGLILVARDKNRLEEVAKELPNSTRIYPCDLASSAQRAELIKLIHELTPDLVINNAGLGFYGPILSHPLSRSQETLAVNVQAVMELSIESAKSLRSKNQKGTILNISSAAGFFPYPTFCVYAATKAFLNNFSQGFDEEMKPHGIRILTACPGQLDTPFRDKAALHFPQNKTPFTLSQNKVVRLLLKQIVDGQQIQIIDWKYRLAINLIMLLPKKCRNAFLIKSLKDRFN